MTYTDAQIEAAAKAMRELWWPNGNPKVGVSDPILLEAARAALDAAEEAGEAVYTADDLNAAARGGWERGSADHMAWVNAVFSGFTDYPTPKNPWLPVEGSEG